MGNKYIVKQISNRYACDLSVQFGYSNRRPNAVISFGLVRKSDGIVLGVVVYGNPVSPSVSSICGDDEFYNVYELNALWIRSDVDARFLTILLKKTISKLDKEIVIAYCEPEQIDIVNAYNDMFIYLGMTVARTDRAYVGELKNTLFGKVVVKPNKHNMSAWYDKENTQDVIRKQKHRYIYFNCDTVRYSELYESLRYPEKPKPNP